MVLYIVGRHSGTKQSSVSVSRSLTIAELSGGRQPLTSQSNVTGLQSALVRICSSSSNLSHSTDSVNSKVRSGTQHGRTVVQMLQNSLVQKALNQEVAGKSNNSSNCSDIACGQTSKLSIAHPHSHTVC